MSFTSDNLYLEVDMLVKGTRLFNFAYTFSNSNSTLWHIIRAVDFKHAAKNLFYKVSPSERSRRVRLYSYDLKDEGLSYDGAVSGLKTFFC